MKRVNISKSAVLSKCNNFRYYLERIWDRNLPTLGIILLNPSKADDKQDDPTISKCITLAAFWRYGSIKVVNLFALRSANRKDLIKASDPIGPENDVFIEKLCRECPQIFCGWGNDGLLLGNRQKKVFQFVEKNRLFCVVINKNGTPRHPLYVKNISAKINFSPDRQ